MVVSILRPKVDIQEVNQLPTWKNLHRQLARVHPSLLFQFGYAAPTVLEFLVSAGGIFKLAHCTKELVAQAPSLPRWKFIAFRQPLEMFEQASIGILIDGTERNVSFGEIKATLGQPNHNRFDVNLYIPYFDKANGEEDPLIWHVLDASVGEYNVMTRVGIPRGFPIEEAPVNAQPLTALQDFSLSQTFLADCREI